jgi:hypothetical protein
MIRHAQRRQQIDRALQRPYQPRRLHADRHHATDQPRDIFRLVGANAAA